MGWFWADTPAPAPARVHQELPPFHPPVSDASPPKGCPMHKKTVDALTPGSKCQKPSSTTAPSSCPVPHARPSPEPSEPKSLLAQLNPLNYMFRDISQAPAPHQTVSLPTEREESTIPKGSGDGNWEYPSPQQMYNALLRKGFTDTDITAVESMVSIHNFLNEGAWEEILGWEARFGGGLQKGLQICSRGEENALPMARQLLREGQRQEPPTLVRFQGRPKDMTPKAAMLQVMGWLYPEKFGTEPPFDRHDWFVSRNINGQTQEVRYVIDYYSGQPEPTGEPVFYLDVRPAFTPTGAAERFIRWGGDVWWRASGGEVREERLKDAKSGKQNWLGSSS